MLLNEERKRGEACGVFPSSSDASADAATSVGAAALLNNKLGSENMMNDH